MTSEVQLFILVTTAFTLTGILTPLMRKLAVKVNFFDTPSADHKTHQSPVPYLGGVAIILGICVPIYLAIATQANLRNDSSLATKIFFPALILGLVGLIDDYLKLSPLLRFCLQTISGIVMAFFLLTDSEFGNPTGRPIFDSVIIVVWVIGITNSINFFDNLDGGASGAVAISCFGIWIIAYNSGQSFIALISFVIVSTMLSFLIWNKSPAKIYMGDAGALFLGCLVSILTLRLRPDTESQVFSLSIPLLLLAVPILDTTVAILSRARRGISIFHGGLDHLSHILVKNGFSKRQTVYILWFLCLVYMSFAILISYFKFESNILLTFSGLLWLGLLNTFLKFSGND